MEDTIIFLQKLLKSTTGITLSVFSAEIASLRTHLQGATSHIFDAFWENNCTHWYKLLLSPARQNVISEFLLPSGITILLYADRANDRIICLGPVLIQNTENLSRLPSVLPVVQSHILYRTADLVIGHLCNSVHGMKIARADTQSSEVPLIHHTITSAEDISQMRQVELRYEYSAALTDAIQQGNISLATHLLGHYNPGTQTTVRNANPLRNAQNYCIVLNTQLRHALENSGIHPYQVDKLSNQIGLEIEQLKKTSQLPDFFQGVIRRYCRLVQEHAYPNLKPLTNLAVTYIKEHLADNLTVKDTAKALTVNANYLSTLFHRDMGMSFIDFVNRERTNQAAALLRHTNLQIQQIASAVGYNNTSYFAKQFLRFQGSSPSHYRRERAT